MIFRKSVTERELLDFLKEGELRFPPLQIVDVQTNRIVGIEARPFELDALLTLRWRSQVYRFGVETRRLWTPKSIAEAAEMAQRKAGLIGVYPLILAPYLGGEQILLLEGKEVSGLDLCGNGVVVVPDKLLLLRTGFPNQFRWEGTIKNVYRKASSIVARTFLLVPTFSSLTELLEQIRRRGGAVTVATVSKVCKSLEADLIIERGRRSPRARRPASPPENKFPQAPQVGPSPFLSLRLLQPEKLLNLLAANYVPPEVRRTFRGKCGLPPEELRKRLAAGAEESSVKVVLTGASSVEAYAVMAREPVQSFYCTDINKALTGLGGDIRETDRFANVAFQETREDFVYYDRRPALTASPIQSYLELVHGDSREQDTADQVRRVILGQLAQQPRLEGG